MTITIQTAVLCIISLCLSVRTLKKHIIQSFSFFFFYDLVLILSICVYQSVMELHFKVKQWKILKQYTIFLFRVKNFWWLKTRINIKYLYIDVKIIKIYFLDSKKQKKPNVKLAYKTSEDSKNITNISWKRLSKWTLKVFDIKYLYYDTTNFA